jgi:hypothetical protein
VDESELGHQKDDVVLFADLHRNWEIIYSFRWEKHVDILFLELRISLLVVDLYNMELGIMFGSGTFAPVAVLTEKVNRLVGFGAPSSVNFAKHPAWPSNGCDTPRSFEYSCMAPTTRPCCALIPTKSSQFPASLTL